ncbi:MAG TPA: hypothetical protein VGM39_19095 [Kofleriaceae bacterium]
MTEPAVPLDPAVRSVRIAAALCERFEELMRGPTQVRATKARRALIGVTGDETGMSLRLGEAQQLYPEIWSHLDDARNAFAAKGTDVSGYDSIRTHEGSAMGVDVQTTEASYGGGRYGYDEYTKTANFNIAGLARARQAITVLQSVTPQIDWLAIIAAEKADPDVAAFTRGTRNKRIIQFGLLAAVILAPFLIVQYMRHRERATRDEWREKNRAEQVASEPPALTDGQRDALATRAKVVRQAIEKARASWPTADVIAAVHPTDKLCPAQLDPPPEAAANDFVTTGHNSDAQFAATDYYAFAKGSVIDDAVVRNADRSLKLVEERIASKTSVPGDEGILASIPQRATIVILDELVEPDGPQLGHAKGTVYVFDFAAGKIICSGLLDVNNDVPDSLASVRNKNHGAGWEQTLKRELDVRIRNALASYLSGA